MKLTSRNSYKVFRSLALKGIRGQNSDLESMISIMIATYPTVNYSMSSR